MQQCKQEESSEACLLRRQSAFCGVFTSPLRLRLLYVLGEGERPVGELAGELGVSLPHLSQHLRVMRDQGCVLTRKEGRTIHYRLASAKILEAARLIREMLWEQIKEQEAAFAEQAG